MTDSAPDLVSKIDATQEAARRHYEEADRSGEHFFRRFQPPVELDEVEEFIEMLTRRVCDPAEHEHLRNTGQLRLTFQRADGRAFYVHTFVWEDEGDVRAKVIANLDSRRVEIAAYLKED